MIARCDESEMGPSHLLSALLSDESHASEIMARFGLTDAHRDAGDDPVASRVNTESLEFHHSMVFNPNVLCPDNVVQEILIKAQDVAVMNSQPDEIGSEHLLWGLAVVDSAEARFLNEHGINRDSLSRLVKESDAAVGAPIEIDFTIAYPGAGRTEPNRWDTCGGIRASNSIASLRVIDAAANRAREGLRVVEDYVRFVLDDSFLVEELKSCRHDLTAALEPIDGRKLLEARDTPQDVGTRISTPSEGIRATPSDIITASFKRTEEATRTLEEYAKLIETADQDSSCDRQTMSRQFEQLRYRVYALEKAVVLTDANRKQLQGRDLCFLVTEAHCTNGLEPAVRAALAAGVGMIQLREKSKTDQEIVSLGKKVRAWARESDALFIMNDRPDLAVAVDADGVHVGQDELSVRDARRILGTNRMVGVSTHTIEQARQAVVDGANYIGVGPVFPSSTKSFQEFAGLEFVQQVAAEITLPWFAIGGIGRDNIEQVKRAGASRIAVSGSICRADDPYTAARELMTRLKSDEPSA